MEQILTANANKVDAVIASNDGTAGGAVAALRAQGLEGLPVSGQDGDHAALNRVAKGDRKSTRLNSSPLMRISYAVFCLKKKKKKKNRTHTLKQKAPHH